MSVEIKRIEWSKDRQAVLAIEGSAFKPWMQSDEKDLEDKVKKGFGLIAYDEKPLAYVIAIPLEKAPYDGCREDRDQENSVYIESLATIPGKPTILRKLVRKLIETCEKKNIQRVTMHVEADSRLYRVLMRSGCREIGRFDNWQGWDKTFAYLEFDILRSDTFRGDTSKISEHS